MTPCNWSFSKAWDTKTMGAISGASSMFKDRWYCHAHSVSELWEPGTAPPQHPFGLVSKPCTDELAKRRQQARAQRWRWWKWYIRTLPKRVLDVLRGACTGGDE